MVLQWHRLKHERRFGSLVFESILVKTFKMFWDSNVRHACGKTLSDGQTIRYEQFVLTGQTQDFPKAFEISVGFPGDRANTNQFLFMFGKCKKLTF